MDVKVMAAQLRSREDALQHDGKPLRIGRGHCHLAPDWGELRVCGYPAGRRCGYQKVRTRRLDDVLAVMTAVDEMSARISIPSNWGGSGGGSWLG